MGITRNQWLAITILLFTILTGGSAQLTDLIGPYGTKLVIALSTLVTGFLAGLQIILGGQGQMTRDVAGIKGDDGNPALRINVNANAPAALASVAVDPAQPNIGAVTPAAREVLKDTAKGA